MEAGYRYLEGICSVATPLCILSLAFLARIAHILKLQFSPYFKAGKCHTPAKTLIVSRKVTFLIPQILVRKKRVVSQLFFFCRHVVCQQKNINIIEKRVPSEFNTYFLVLKLKVVFICAEIFKIISVTEMKFCKCFVFSTQELVWELPFVFVPSLF